MNFAWGFWVIGGAEFWSRAEIYGVFYILYRMIHGFHVSVLCIIIIYANEGRTWSCACANMRDFNYVEKIYV